MVSYIAAIETEPLTKTVVAHAPVRVADVGGWSDTWFAEHGVVCNLAVGPGVTVSASETNAVTNTAVSIIDLVDYGRRLRLDAPGRAWLQAEHPILHHCLTAHVELGAPVELSIRSAVPAGSALGTSAAVGVACVAALRSLSGLPVEPNEIGHLAHRAETESGLQSGVQDHAAAAFGGASRIDVAYPKFSVESLVLSPATRSELGRRLITLYLGRPHDSSELHRMVIRRLEATGSRAAELQDLRGLADAAAEALIIGDLRTYGSTFDGTIDAQRALHPDLVSADADMIRMLAVRFGGHVKVNGAGGLGGSVTVLGPADDTALSSLRHELSALSGARILDLRLWNDGVTVS
jgi:D-glycero-alpha-D-manno-heptose-7-phosphate kinase